MTIDRKNSRPLDVHRWSDHPEAKSLVDAIWNQYFPDSFKHKGKGNRPTSSYKKQFKVLLLDLYVAWLEDPDMAIGIGLSKRAYKVGSRYNSLFISFLMVEIVHHLYNLSLIDMKKGSEVSKLTTRIKPTELLVKNFKVFTLSLLDFSGIDSLEVIVLNNTDYLGNKRKSLPLEYEDSDFDSIPLMREQLQSYNQLLWKSFIDIPTLERPYIEREIIVKGKKKLERIHPNQSTKFVRRIFYRGDWNLGGRFHGGWWQRVGEDWRRQIYINNEPTVEQDYSGLHINLLYGLEGVQPEGDPYHLDLILDVDANEQRAIVKGLVLMALNAATPKKSFSILQTKTTCRVFF